MSFAYCNEGRKWWNTFLKYRPTWVFDNELVLPILIRKRRNYIILCNRRSMCAAFAKMFFSLDIYKKIFRWKKNLIGFLRQKMFNVLNTYCPLRMQCALGFRANILARRNSQIIAFGIIIYTVPKFANLLYSGFHNFFCTKLITNFQT